MPGAARAGLASCAGCGLLSRPTSAAKPGYCPRCGSRLAWRREGALQRTWALTVAAAMLYVPANALPVLTTTGFGWSQSDTILGGVEVLYRSGSWPLALIVLVASIVIPLGKITALAYLLIGVQRRSARNLRVRARLYRVIALIGRWSMLDVFVATYTVALVQLPPLLHARPGPGIGFFMVVVVLTLLATRAFDPRLIFDAAHAGGEAGG